MELKVRNRADSPLIITLAILAASAIIVFVILYFDKNDNYDTTRMPNTSSNEIITEDDVNNTLFV